MGREIGREKGSEECRRIRRANTKKGREGGRRKKKEKE